MADHSFHQNRINRKEEVEKAYSTKIMKKKINQNLLPMFPQRKSCLK